MKDTKEIDKKGSNVENRIFHLINSHEGLAIGINRYYLYYMKCVLLTLNLIRLFFSGSHGNYNTKKFIRCLSHQLFLIPVLICALSGISAYGDDRPDKPNVVLVLVDDLGWQDVKCYDIDEPSPMETPNIDNLATKGVKFWQAYSPAPVCAPSRAAILSGHHPVRGEMTSVAGGFPPHPGHPTRSEIFSPWYTSRVPVKTFTLAEALKEEGYVTGHRMMR